MWFASTSTSSSEFCVPSYKYYTRFFGRLVGKANRAFNGAFNAQLMASFSLISISTFETMAAAAVDPKMAAKFVLLMLVAFIQLSLWCVSGTLVYTQVCRLKTLKTF